MVVGYMLIKASLDKEDGVYNQLLKFQEITELYPLFGEYTFIAKANVDSYDYMGRFICSNIKTLDGVVDTKIVFTQ